jgi:hypothetical protein
VVLLRQHGCLVVADSADLAFSGAINLDAAAEATYRARLLGDDSTACPPEFLEHVGNEEARGHRRGLRRATPGWFSLRWVPSPADDGRTPDYRFRYIAV